MATPADSIALFTPILDQGIRSVNFFNGRLLTSRDLGREQDARRQADARLGQAMGAGIAWGLEVNRQGEPLARTVQVKAGLAVNRAGQALQLGSDQVVTLVAQPDAASATATGGFTPCGVLSGNTYVAGDGLYLLTLAPTDVGEGKAPVLALDPGNVRCNTDATVEAVQLRMLRISMEVLSARGLDTNALGAAAVSRLRNGAAYACFGFPGVSDAHVHPGVEPAASLVDAMRTRGLSDCDVPLALVYLTASGIVFVDRWAVRRRIASDAAAPRWSALLGEEMDALSEAQLGQFQEQLNDVSDAAIGALRAADSFTWLPSAGFLDATGPRRLDWHSFLGPHQPVSEAPLSAGSVRDVLIAALRRDPVPVSEATHYRVYRISGSAQWLFVRESPLPRAEEVWLDGPRAGLPGVSDVQTAIDTLRARSCRQLALWPDAPIHERIGSLTPGSHVTICFEAGDYALEKPIQLRGLGHVRIHGAGPATRLVNQDGEFALLVDRCASVSVTNLFAEMGTVRVGSDESGIGVNGALTIRNTPSVHLEGVGARCGGGSRLGGAGIVISNDSGALATVAHVIACEVAAGDNQVGIQCINTAVAIVRDNVVQGADGKASVLRGIVVAGQSAEEVHIECNVVRAAVQGISIGLSQKEVQEKAALQAQRVVISGNRVFIALTQRDRTRNRFGVSVGNAISTLVVGNRVHAEAQGMGEAEWEGLRLTGVYGRHLVVRDNHFDGCPIGIQFIPLAFDQQRECVWAFQTNLAEPGSGKTAEVLRMSAALLKLTIREHNVGG